MALLAVTTAVRGLGAGIIYDVALVSLPVRRRIGAIRLGVEEGYSVRTWLRTAERVRGAEPG